MRDGQQEKLDSWLVDPKMPETFKTWLNQVVIGLSTQHDDLINQAHHIFAGRPELSIMMPYKESRKIMAQYFMKDEHKKYSAFLFKLLDGKSIDDLIWKTIEPAAAATFKVEGE